MDKDDKGCSMGVAVEVSREHRLYICWELL